MAAPMMRVVLSDRQLQTYMTQMFRRMGTLKPFFIHITGIIHGSIVANFRMQGRPTRWRKLKEATIEARRRARTWPGFKGATPILMATGDLWRSIGTYKRITRSSLEYGTTGIHYASAMQFGVKKKKVPARPFVLFQRSDINEITAIAAAYVFDPVTAKGLR